MVNFRFSEYFDILVMMPLLIVSLGILLFTTTSVIFKVSDYIESKKDAE